MSDPSVQSHTNESRHIISEVESLRAELTQLRTERERLLEYLGRIRPLAKSIALISEADQDAKDMADSIWTISIAALTQREGGKA